MRLQEGPEPQHLSKQSRTTQFCLDPPTLSSPPGGLCALAAPGRAHSARQDSGQNAGKTNNVLMTLFLLYLHSDASTLILFWVFFLVVMVP